MPTLRDDLIKFFEATKGRASPHVSPANSDDEEEGKNDDDGNEEESVADSAVDDSSEDEDDASSDDEDEGKAVSQKRKLPTSPPGYTPSSPSYHVPW